MDTIDNMRTFLAVAKAGSFSAAARDLNTVPSVVSKKINRLEDQIGAALFLRSTRKLTLTETGDRFYPRFLSIVHDVAETFADIRQTKSDLDGTLRIKCPTTLSVLHFGRIVTEFQAAHPRTKIDLVLMDRSVNPIEEGFDIAIGALPATFPNVDIVALCPYLRQVVAAPDYLRDAGPLDHPRDLLDHTCLTFHPSGSNWTFIGEQGPVSVDVHSRFSVNDSQVLVDAALLNLGVALVAGYLARPYVETGQLCEVLPGFAVPDIWVNAYIPKTQIKKELVSAMLDWIRDAVAPVAPWDRPRQGSVGVAT
ncbi:LysR family transcriptional regulator [Pseudooceanicola sediminis]|uniref:LysR family transcriptional regulator n=1 Tax=Pseudooceanicola sediminis TaxID=2211117 RepID=A0A399IWC4_9RHOB|nr:LysR family transcriptional regulator [Pseudooceanicola sediminis]KAA2314969.1 LysR family transcriptional regulator [Puniceibacterium sp. HSS470]RII37341.1 LysR family transcriptional regulator [Pseudooceanicola sediminis]|tara:strand:- start:9965 stop:10891 length:927 start_codon:yes stop_codon:yes gene_type:complete